MRLRIALPLLAAIAITAHAQSPKFEVASVKANHSEGEQERYPRFANGKLIAENTTMRTILQVAYGLTKIQINGPGWLDSDHFDLAATSPQGVPDTELMPMLQALLKDRFNFAAHIEKKEMAVYNLVVLKEGPKFSIFDAAHIPPTPARNGASAMIIGPMTMTDLAGHLTSTTGRLVLNKTGLEGRYFCAVTYTPLTTQANEVATGSGALDIFAAIQLQLGLKLESSKEPVDILVVDRAERVPTEN
jgi:uncharacterized protein (TIGR03435 family)